MCINLLQQNKTVFYANILLHKTLVLCNIETTINFCKKYVCKYVANQTIRRLIYMFNIYFWRFKIEINTKIDFYYFFRDIFIYLVFRYRTFVMHVPKKGVMLDAEPRIFSLTVNGLFYALFTWALIAVILPLLWNLAVWGHMQSRLAEARCHWTFQFAVFVMKRGSREIKVLWGRFLFGMLSKNLYRFQN